MITKEELQKKRTPSELYDYIDNIFNNIESDSTEKKKARVKKHIYKVLREEIYPFSIYCKLKYSGKDLLCSPVIGNQGYDAKIETNTGEIVEIIEFTWPIDGEKEHQESIELNEQEFTGIDVWDYQDNSKRLEIIDRIILKAFEKSLIDYSSKEASTLVFVLYTIPYFGMKKLEHPEDIEYLTQELKGKEYKVNAVYLMLLPKQELIAIK